MPTPPQIEPEPSTIGVYLQWARSQKGLELSDVEEQTKIRTKYLQALETEEWDVFPGSAYARGFLATYAKLLGLDADALVDEYRRQVETEEPTANLSAYGEPVLEGRRRVGAPNGGRRWPFVAAFVAALVAVIVVVAFVTGSGDDSGKQAGKQASRHAGGAPPQTTPANTTALKLHAKTGMTVCLLGDGGAPLVDSQTLSAGARVGPFRATHFRLDVNTGGVVKVKIDNEIQRLAPKKPSSFRVKGTKITPISYKGRACP